MQLWGALLFLKVSVYLENLSSFTWACPPQNRGTWLPQGMGGCGRESVWLASMKSGSPSSVL